jgi:hypothetical protein
MASLACGRRLSLRNQYDTKTPRARFFICCARQTDGAVIRAIHHPSRERPGHARVTKNSYSVGFEMSVENFFRNEKIRKIPSEIPNHCRTFAAICDAKRQQSHFQT